jgi:hypothetical protein
MIVLEQRHDALLLLVDRTPAVGVERAQRGAHLVEGIARSLFAGALDADLTRAVRAQSTIVEHAIDLVEVDGVVHNDLVLRVLGEDRLPEADLRLDAARTRERFGGRERRRGNA